MMAGGMEKRVKRGEQKVTVALKPAIVLPVGQPANQAAQSGRDSENQKGKRGRGSDGCHGYLVGDASALVYLWAAGACKVGPLVEQMCARLRVYQSLAAKCAHVRRLTGTQRLTHPLLSL